MKNAADHINDTWGDLNDRAAAALRPNLAGRVMGRVRAAREKASARATLFMGLGTAFACLTLTLALNFLSTRHASEQAIAQWSAVAVDDDAGDPGI